MTITDLDEELWTYLQRNVRTEYEIPEGAVRVCLTFSREGEERHAEMPMAAIVGLLMGLGMVSASQAFRALTLTVQAALTPDALPDHLEDQRDAADLQRVPCQHHTPPHLYDCREER